MWEEDEEKAIQGLDVPIFLPSGATTGAFDAFRARTSDAIGLMICGLPGALAGDG